MRGPALPSEPELPSRFRRLVLTVAAVVLVAAVGLLVWRNATAGQFQDPALSGDSDPATPQPAPTGTP